MTFLEKCLELFGKDDLYKILGVSKDASVKERPSCDVGLFGPPDERNHGLWHHVVVLAMQDLVKKGYHRVSLKVHPDRVGEHQKEWATIQFQALGRVYSILSDTDRRAVYDDTGCVDEDDPMVTQERDWADYWRLLFKPITLADIEKFETEYVGSAEEEEDLRAAYLACEGDMGGVLDRVPCASVDSEDRLRALLQRSIDSGQLPAFRAFTHESKAKKAARKRHAAKEAAEAEEEKRKLGLDNSEDSLRAMIQARQEARGAAMGSFFDQLEAKYAKTDKRASKSKKKAGR